ncbi:MAG: flagellar hook-length control protein FliK [Rhodobacteraceae bacterium]|nr:flagellar hook-length control protein FliK [Paracoccaceae bacterium]
MQRKVATEPPIGSYTLAGSERQSGKQMLDVANNAAPVRTVWPIPDVTNTPVEPIPGKSPIEFDGSAKALEVGKSVQRTSSEAQRTVPSQDLIGPVRPDLSKVEKASADQPKSIITAQNTRAVWANTPTVSDPAMVDRFAVKNVPGDEAQQEVPPGPKPSKAEPLVRLAAGPVASPASSPIAFPKADVSVSIGENQVGGSLKMDVLETPKAPTVADMSVARGVIAETTVPTRKQESLLSERTGAAEAKLAAEPAKSIAPQTPQSVLPETSTLRSPILSPSLDSGVIAVAIDGSQPDRPLGDMARTASLPSASPQQVVTQVAEVLRQPANGPIEVSLSPEELGKLRITMTGTEASMVVQVSADRSETLELLRRHIDLLAQELKSQGFESLSFEFAGSDQFNAFGGGENTSDGSGAALSGSDASEDVSPIRTPPIGASGTDVLDVRL